MQIIYIPLEYLINTIVLNSHAYTHLAMDK